jgi:hypothetical protein
MALAGGSRLGAFEIMTPEGSSYVFGYGITLSDLYLAKGIR